VSPRPLGASEAAALARRVCHAEPGEGYHREHVRALTGAGAPSPELMTAVVASLDERFRVECIIPEGRSGRWREGCEAAGLELEVSLPEGYRRASDGDLVALETWGRPGRGAERPAVAFPRLAAERGEPEARIAVHDRGTRPALAAFLQSLTPGRSYPPGTLLSESERAETRRKGDLEADWVLALDAAGAVVGGVVLEADPRPHRSHVRRLHVDVLRRARGCGVATRLFRAAREHAAALGALRVESDPLAGNLGAVSALRGAGLEDCGRERGSWRMRTPTASWDADTLQLSARAG
jgi:RimJ/RimL family protein N-acetyltransferase